MGQVNGMLTATRAVKFKQEAVIDTVVSLTPSSRLFTCSRVVFTPIMSRRKGGWIKTEAMVP